MNVLITGGTGFIGALLARKHVQQGDNVVIFDVAPNMSRIADIANAVKMVRGNLAYASEVYNVVKENKIDRILHLGSMLSAPSDVNPWASFQVNVVGSINVLEAARYFGDATVVFPSTIATFGHDTETVAADNTVQHPTTMYGCGKAYIENLGRFYRDRLGVDFRAIRFPSVIGPGAKVRHVSQYNAWMIEFPLRGKPFECFVTEGTKMPIMYFKDAANAVDAIADAPRDAIKTVNYNIAGITPTTSAKDIELVVKKHVPDAQITYVPDPEIMKYYASFKIDTFDDSRARNEWGWCPAFPDIDTVLLDFKAELQQHPEWYD
ncbi:MAG: NAD-dependent epimerase/dehydratase family protein [Dehalococcoidia bacterium]|nr:NAD-dependent epimerase/dehydratase family protein [Dehalococcoidia bacterium]